MCHDEPRESFKIAKGEKYSNDGEEEVLFKSEEITPVGSSPSPNQRQNSHQLPSVTNSGSDATLTSRNSHQGPSQIDPSSPDSETQNQSLTAKIQLCGWTVVDYVLCYILLT